MAITGPDFIALQVTDLERSATFRAAAERRAEIERRLAAEAPARAREPAAAAVS